MRLATAGFTCAALLLSGCGSPRAVDLPAIEFTRVPQADPGGREKHEIIEGSVKGWRPGQQIVLYARSGNWWVQPLATQPFTQIQSSAKWSTATHLGTEYAALLVDAGYQPPANLDALPKPGGAVAAVSVVQGRPTPPSTYLPFSGYEWRVRDAPSSRGGNNLYDPRNVRVDAQGHLHLRIAKVSGTWTCAELSLTRSLGYGTYSFVVRDTSGLEPAAVFSMFTWDYSGAADNYREMDIEVSRWGDPESKDAQYVIQPFYVPTNVVRFSLPKTTVTHSFRWEPDRWVQDTARPTSLRHACRCRRRRRAGSPPGCPER